MAIQRRWETARNDYICQSRTVTPDREDRGKSALAGMEDKVNLKQWSLNTANEVSGTHDTLTHA